MNRFASRSHPLCAVLALACLSLSPMQQVLAQPAGPGPGPGPMPPPATYEAAVMAQPPVVEGRITRMLINPYGEVDGLLLDQRTVVRFPPHLSEPMQRVLAPGQSVRVFGQGEGRDTIKADAIVNLANGQTVIDRPPPVEANPPLPPHLRAAQLQQLTVQGRITLVLAGPRGEANGVILDDGSIVRFAPDSVRFSLEPGTPLAAQGLGTRSRYGTAIEAIAVGASTQQLQPLYSRMP